MVAGFHPCDVWADLLDDAGPFMAKHDRKRVGECALHHLQVGMAQAAGPHADQHVLPFQAQQFNLLDPQRVADLVQYGCLEFHG
jgi:hypothetical protein